MMYLSLIELMRLYGNLIKEEHSVRSLSYEATSRPFDRAVNYAPFRIAPMGVAEKRQRQISQEQILNDLHFNATGEMFRIYGYNTPEILWMPPVLEVEWLRTKLILSDEILDVFTQLGYMTMAHIMAWGVSGHLDRNAGSWMDYLQENGAIIEVEDLEDTAKILVQNPLPPVHMPKVRSWNTILVYGTDLNNVLLACERQSNKFKEIYYHLPVMLSLFMVDYFGNDLKSLSKSECLSWEHGMQDRFAEFDRYSVATGDLYTYGASNNITQKDRELVRTVFNTVYNKLHAVNTNIGLITFNDYTRIRGPERTEASVRLTGMSIKWDQEMKRVAEGKEGSAQNEEDEDPFDEF